MVWVALVEAPARGAVEAHQQHIRPAVLGPMVGHALAQGGDVTRMIVVMPDGADIGHVPGLQQVSVHRVQGRGAAAGGVLGIERHDQQPVAALGLHIRQDRGHRRLAVAHGVVDHQWVAVAVGQFGLQQPGHLLGMDLERRAARLPDGGVFFGRFGWPDVEDDAVED